MILNKVWDEVMMPEFQKAYFKDLWESVYPENPSFVTLPSKDEVFTAFHLTDLPDVKVVIVGQDPYPTPGNAHGLAFSVKPGVDIPASLRNIYKELALEYPDSESFKNPTTGCLTGWAKQGVFLLNRVLTVEASKANSHRGYDWERFTAKVIECIDQNVDNVVYILWGKNALECTEFVRNPRSLVLTGPHPSPLSAYRGFFGCRHFKKANEYLMENDKLPISWTLVG